MKNMMMLMSVLSLAISACGTDEANNIEAGKVTFDARCKSCHTVVSGGDEKQGPNQFGIEAKAAEIIASAEYKAVGKATTVDAFLLESINEPKLFVDAEDVATYGADKMPSGYKSSLTDAQKTELVAYLKSLK